MFEIAILLQKEIEIPKKKKKKPNQTSVKYQQGCHVALINLAYTWTMYCSMVHFLHMLLSSSA